MIDKADKTAAQTLACLFACCCLFFLAGCEKKSPTSESNAAFQDRLQAARLITMSSEKNTALEKLAGNAAKEGHGKIVMEAIAEINQTGIRNSAAANAAPLLANAGQTKDAIKVVWLINDTSLRNEVLAKIAEQE